MRYLGYRDVWENCFHSTYGKKQALRYAERAYCTNGKRYDTDTDKPDTHHDSDYVCPDWPKCHGLCRSMKM